MKFKDSINKQTRLAITAHLILSTMVTFVLISGLVKYLSNGAIDVGQMFHNLLSNLLFSKSLSDVEQIFSTFLVLTIIVMSIILIVLVIVILTNSHYSSQGITLLASLSFVIISIYIAICVLIKTIVIK